MPASPKRKAAAQTDSVDALHKMILQSLEDDQAVETISIPLAGKSAIADHMVIASGRSTRQVASMAQKLQQKMKEQFGVIARVEGLQTADWVLMMPATSSSTCSARKCAASTIWSACGRLVTPRPPIEAAYHRPRQDRAMPRGRSD